ncbi:MAG: ATP-binding protein [Thermoprotei archaeon]|nr:MAG: ATP-binding protein [Thermoprotei archaeon]
MNQLFVDRTEELAFLEEKYKENRAQLIVIYGRRRIGKTELLLKFVKNKNYIYFLCEKTSPQLNILKMARKMAEYLGKKSFARIQFADWEDLFREFLEWKTGDEKVVIILDEFPYLIEIDKGVVSVFQKIWDEYLSKRTDIVLILCGSSIGMMETDVLGYKSPLYGRRTGQWKVTELKLPYIKSFVPSYTFTELLYLYGALGGVPAYLCKLDPKLKVFENIEKLFLRKGAELYEEAENLLRQELREPRNYKLILEALAEGKRRISEIANTTGLDKAAVSRYMDTLELLDIVSYETPVLEKPKTKKRLYYIKDNYFNFWFRYIYPNKDLIEEKRGKIVLEEIIADYNNYMSIVFEKIAKDFVLKISLPIKIHKIGRHWWKTSKGESLEIDLLGFNKNKKEYIIVEVKWSRLKFSDVKRIYKALINKATKLNISGKLYYCIIAKEIENKDSISGAISNVLLFDLKDLEKVYFSQKQL